LIAKVNQSDQHFKHSKISNVLGMQQLYIERLKGSVSNKMFVYQSLVYIFFCNQKTCKAFNYYINPATYMDW